MMKRVALLVAGVVVLALAGSDEANAETFSPTFCAPLLNGTLGGTQYTIPYQRSVSGFANSSSASLYVTCPIAREDIENTNGIGFGVVYVYNPSGKTTSCTLWGRDVFGNLISGDSFMTASTSSAGSQALYFDPGPSVSQEWSTWALLCTLPAGGGIDSYTVIEN